MKTKVFVFFITVFLFSLFLKHDFLKIKEVKAFYTPSCSSVEINNYANPSASIPGLGEINQPVGIMVNIRFAPDTTILKRYIYDGFGWVEIKSSSDVGYSWFKLTKTYTEAKDYAVAGGFTYLGPNGETGTITCISYVRVFEKEVKNYEPVTLTYPNRSIDLPITSSESKPYIGGVKLNYGQSDTWIRGSNLGYTPYPPMIGMAQNCWQFHLEGALGYYSSSAFQFGCDSLPWNSVWVSSSNTYVWVDPYRPVLSSLTTSLNINMLSPRFKDGEGTGAYSIFTANNVIVYSRAIAKNDPPTLPCLPGACVTSTSTPTQTPTPISVKVKNPYCSSFGLYPYGPYQDKGGNGNTDSLLNTYSKYVSFTAPFTGKVNGLAVKAGNWGGAWRTVSCKVTNANGTVNISQEASASAFRSDSSVQWRKIAFPTQFDLTGGQQYRLYCRGSDSGMVYWIYDPTKNANNNLAKLYGRTYAVCMQ